MLYLDTDFNCPRFAFPRFPRLMMLINKSLCKSSADEVEARLRKLSHPLDISSVQLEGYTASKVICLSMFHFLHVIGQIVRKAIVIANIFLF